jgi:hypothetical protein
MIYHNSFEDSYISIVGDAVFFSPDGNMTQDAFFVKKIFPRKNNKVEEQYIYKHILQRELDSDLTPVKDEALIAKLMLLGLA